MTAAIVPYGSHVRSLRGPVLRFIGWLLATPAPAPQSCSTCGCVGEHAPWCNWTVRVSHGSFERTRH